MIKEIHTIPGSFEDHILLAKDYDLIQMPDIRLIPLFGANGVGKTTLLKALNGQVTRQFLKPNQKGVDITLTKPTDCYAYIGSTDNFKRREPSSYSQAFDPAFLSMKLDARDLSEGQSIVFSLFDLLKGACDKKQIPDDDGKDKTILIDEMDSGLSIDNLETAMRYVKRTLKNRDDIQFIFSFNNPYMLHFFDTALSMYDGKPVALHSDKEMLAEIRQWKKKLNSKRKNKDGSFKTI